MIGCIIVSKNICLNILAAWIFNNGFLNNVSIRLIDKTDRKNYKRREVCQRRTLKTYSLFGLNVEDSVWPTLILKNVLMGMWMQIHSFF